MRLVNRDLTQEKIWVNVSEGEFYAEIFSKVRNRKTRRLQWKTETYWEDYDFPIDRELCNILIKKIIKYWNLNNPKIFLAFGN